MGSRYDSLESWKETVTYRELVLRTVLSIMRVTDLCPEICSKYVGGCTVLECLDCSYGNAIVDELYMQTHADGSPILSRIVESSCGCED